MNYNNRQVYRCQGEGILCYECAHPTNSAYEHPAGTHVDTSSGKSRSKTNAEKDGEYIFSVCVHSKTCILNVSLLQLNLVYKHICLPCIGRRQVGQLRKNV